MTDLRYILSESIIFIFIAQLFKEDSMHVLMIFSNSCAETSFRYKKDLGCCYRITANSLKKHLLFHCFKEFNLLLQT